MTRKIIISIIYVAGFSTPLGQIIGIFIVYLLYFIYVASVRPFVL